MTRSCVTQDNLIHTTSFTAMSDDENFGYFGEEMHYLLHEPRTPKSSPLYPQIRPNSEGSQEIYTIPVRPTDKPARHQRVSRSLDKAFELEFHPSHFDTPFDQSRHSSSYYSASSTGTFTPESDTHGKHASKHHLEDQNNNEPEPPKKHSPFNIFHFSFFGNKPEKSPTKEDQDPKFTRKASAGDDQKMKNVNNSNSSQTGFQKVAAASLDKGDKLIGQIRGALNTGHRLAQRPEQVNDEVDETKFLLPQGKDSPNLSSLSIDDDDRDCGSDNCDKDGKTIGVRKNTKNPILQYGKWVLTIKY